MRKFFKLMDNLVDGFPVHIEIYYSKMLDWCIKIWKEGCASDYPESEYEINEEKRTFDAILCDIQESDRNLCFRKAYKAVRKWLLLNTKIDPDLLMKTGKEEELDAEPWE